MKVITLLGTRPDIIRLSRVMSKLDKYFDHIMVHTGQNYDYCMSSKKVDGLVVEGFVV